MKVPISGRVKTSSMASMARRMSVAFFLVEPNAGAKIRSIEDSDSGHDVLRIAAPVGVGPLHRDLALDDVAVEEGPELLGEILLDPQGDVVEVDQQGGVGSVHGGLAHQMPAGPYQRSVHVSLVFGPPAPSSALGTPGRTRCSRQVGRAMLRDGDPHGVTLSPPAVEVPGFGCAAPAGSPVRASALPHRMASAKNLAEGV